MEACEEALPIAAEEADRHPRAVVWHLAWPAIALSSFQVVNNLLDRAFLGRLPAAAIAGQSAAMNVSMFMFTCVMALATAPTALVSRAFGGQNYEEMRTATRKSINLSFALGILLGLVTVAVAWPAARAFLPDDDPEAIAYMAHYLQIYAVAIPAISIINNLAAALRGIGDTRSPMVLSGIQIALHIILNIALIFPTRTVHVGSTAFVLPGAGMGLTGAATALAVSAWASAIAYLSYSGRTPLGACWRPDRVGWTWAWRIQRIAAPALWNGVIRVLSMAVYTIILKNTVDGSSAIAAMALGFAVESIMFMPSFGIASAAAALVGQSLGMKDPARAERLGWISAHMAGIITLVLCIPLAIFAFPIAEIMSPGKEAIIHQTGMLIQWVCATEVTFAYFGVFVGAMQGAGDTARPMWITIFCSWFLRIPLAVALALSTARIQFTIPRLNLHVDTGTFVVGIGLGGLGAWIAMSASQLVQGFLAGWLFRQGRWKTKTV